MLLRSFLILVVALCLSSASAMVGGLSDWKPAAADIEAHFQRVASELKMQAVGDATVVSPPVLHRYKSQVVRL